VGRVTALGMPTGGRESTHEAAARFDGRRGDGSHDLDGGREQHETGGMPPPFRRFERLEAAGSCVDGRVGRFAASRGGPRAVVSSLDAVLRGLPFVRHGLWLVAVLFAAVYVWGAVVGYAGFDAHVYWDVWRHGGLYSHGEIGDDAYLYSPAFAELVWPLTRLPWHTFFALWTAGLVGVYAWLLAPLGRRWAVPLLVLLVPDIVFGNVNALFALVLVLGVRYPAVWAFPLLTKVTPAVGIVWFGARRDWRRLGAVLGVTALVVAVSAAAAPGLWGSWFRLLVEHSGFAAQTGSASQTFTVPTLARLPLACALTLVAARRNAYALLAPAMVLAAPILSLNTLAILAALPRLRALPREAPAELPVRRTAVEAAVASVRLGIVCPMANEAATALDFVDAVLGACGRYGFRSVTLFTVLDTVSEDDTRSLLAAHRRLQPQLRVVWAPETRGVADAYVRGYREALAAGCGWILEIDAGFSHQPSDIGRFVEAMAGNRDCVFGSRFRPGGSNLATLRRRAVSRGGTALANLLLGTKLTDMTSGYQLFSRAALEAVLAKGIRSKGPFFQTEIRTHCRHLRLAEVPISYNAGSHAVGRRAVAESFVVLARLFARRLVGDL
jgi:dolichol-phosphate mannosyltransferase